MNLRNPARALLLGFAVLCSALSARGQGGGIGSYSSPVINNMGRPIPGANIAVCSPLATTAASVTNNVATLTMTSNPVTAGFVSGVQMIVAGFTGGDTYFNVGALTNGQFTGSVTILSVTSTTISYSLTHANGSAASNGTALQEGNQSTSCAGLATITSDPALANPVSQPLVSDYLGNWSAFAGPGVYYVQFYGAGISTTVRQVTISCVPFTVVTCGNGPGGSPGQIEWNNAGSLAGILGSSVTGATGAILLTAGADTTTPLNLAGHSGTQSAPIFTGSGGLLQWTGAGNGSFTPAHNTALLNAQVNGGGVLGIIVTNSNAGGSSGALSSMGIQMSNTGVGCLNGGNSVGDGSGNFTQYCESNGNGQILLGANVGTREFDVERQDTSLGPSPDTGDIFCIWNWNGSSIAKQFCDNGNGQAEFFGTTSGQASIGVAAAAGTPNKINLPTSSGTAGQILTTDGNNPQQTSWSTPTSLSCAYQSAASPVTGTGAAATYYTCSVPALAAGTGIAITVVSKHTTGTANIAYTVQFGGTSTSSSTPTGSANQLEVIKCLLMNNAGSTTAQTVTTTYMDSNAGSNAITLNTMAINTSSAQTLNIQFNVANTDQITPEQFLVQLVQ